MKYCANVSEKEVCHNHMTVIGKLNDYTIILYILPSLAPSLAPQVIMILSFNFVLTRPRQTLNSSDDFKLSVIRYFNPNPEKKSY